jgi:hypothetical protein
MASQYHLFFVVMLSFLKMSTLSSKERDLLCLLVPIFVEHMELEKCL